jgi:hypothetical protein
MDKVRNSNNSVNLLVATHVFSRYNVEALRHKLHFSPAWGRFFSPGSVDNELQVGGENAHRRSLCTISRPPCLVKQNCPGMSLAWQEQKWTESATVEGSWGSHCEDYCVEFVVFMLAWLTILTWKLGCGGRQYILRNVGKVLPDYTAT